MSRLFAQESHDLKADVPNLAVKTKRRKAQIFSYAPVSAPISGWKSMIWRRNPKPWRGPQKMQPLLRMSRTCLPPNGKKHVSATNAHQFLPRQSLFVGNPKVHQAAKTSKFVALKGGMPARPRMRAENAQTCLTMPAQNCRRMPQNSATHSPKTKLTRFCQIMSARSYIQIRPKFVNIAVPKL